MSRRTAEACKAIASAWENEQELIKQGEGTRDWTVQQQQDIIERGKAYDENGRAFEGQHMRSAEAYPESQGDPKNIQFLTREEHLAAHGGNWQNPTNGYYDIKTKRIIDFGDGEIVPCPTIKLTNPLIPKIEIPKNCNVTRNEQRKNTEKVHKGSNAKRAKKPTHNIGEIARKAANFAYEHREIGAHLALELAPTIIRVVANKRGSKLNNATTNSQTVNLNKMPTSPTKLQRSSPRRHMVPSHSQSYHTKTGIKIIQKAPFPRGGRNV